MSASPHWRLVLGAAAALLLLTIGLALASHFGVPNSVINASFLFLSIPGYALVGLLCRTADVEDYYVAGRRIAAPFNGMATAADWMSAASILGLAGILFVSGLRGDGQHAGGVAYLLGWTGGFCLLGLLFAGKLNRLAGYTLPDALATRFPGLGVRWVAALGVVVCSSFYLIAQIYAIGLLSSMLSGLSFEIGVFLALGGILMCSFLGGMRAVTWTQVVQCVVIVLSVVGLSVVVAIKWQGHPFSPLAGAQSLEHAQKRLKSLVESPAEQAARQHLKADLANLNAQMADPAAARDTARGQLLRELQGLKNASTDPAQTRHDIQRKQAALNALQSASDEKLIATWAQERDALERQILVETVSVVAASAPAQPAAGLQGVPLASGVPVPSSPWWVRWVTYVAEINHVGQSMAGFGNSLALIFCFMLGTAALPHIVVRSYTASSPRQAQQSIAWALLFIVVVYACAAALAAMMKDVVLSELVGAPFAHLPDWTNQLRLRKLGLLSIQDLNADGVVQYAEIRLATDFLVLAAPDMVGAPSVFTGLIAAAALAAALSTADGLLLTISNALVHDLYVQAFAPQASAIVRVTLSKLVLLMVALFAAWFASNQHVDILFLVSSAFSLAAATFFPALCLCFYAKRMNAAGILAGMVTGFCVALFYVLLHSAGLRAAFGLGVAPALWLGIDAVAAGVFGVPAGLFAAYAVSWCSRFKNARRGAR
jgi:cation/acetate symporter